MKACSCGKEIEFWMSECKDCYKKSHENQEPSSRQDSIERQSALRSVAMLVQAKDIDLKEFDKLFEHFLKKIKG